MDSHNQILVTPMFKAEEADIGVEVTRCEGRLNLLSLLSSGEFSIVVVAEDSMKTARDYGRLARLARTNLDKEFKIILLRKSQGALPSEFDEGVQYPDMKAIVGRL